MTLSSRSSAALGWLIFGTVLFAGCGGSSLTVYPVTGRVEMAGKPVEGAQVLFQAEGAPPAQGITDAEGKFKLTTSVAGEGAVAGDHKVSIVKMMRDPASDPNDPYAAMRNVLPPQYGQTARSPLTAKVTSGVNDFPFVLTP